MQEKDRKLGGDIAIAFFCFGAPASLLIGWLTDVVDRRKLFVAIVLVGEIGAVSTVWVTTYWPVRETFNDGGGSCSPYRPGLPWLDMPIPFKTPTIFVTLCQ